MQNVETQKCVPYIVHSAICTPKKPYYCSLVSLYYTNINISYRDKCEIYKFIINPTRYINRAPFINLYCLLLQC